MDWRLVLHHVLWWLLNGRRTGICVHTHVVGILVTHLQNGCNCHKFKISFAPANRRIITSISLPHSPDRACDVPLASADYSCDCDGPFARVAATRCHRPCLARRCQPQPAVYSWCTRWVAAEVAVGEVSFRFVGAAAGASAGGPSPPLDSRDCRAASSRSAPCSGCSSPSGRRADSAETAAYWPDCDGSVCSGASEHPCHRPLDSDRACRSSCRNL